MRVGLLKKAVSGVLMARRTHNGDALRDVPGMYASSSSRLAALSAETASLGAPGLGG